MFTSKAEALSNVERLQEPHTNTQGWWSSTATNMVVGPAVEPPFAGTHIVELASRDVAVRFLEALRETGVAATVLAVAPTPTKERRRLLRLQRLLRLMPRPASTGGSMPPVFLGGGVVPNQAQLERLDTLPQEEPVLVLSFNQYRERASDPQTGENKSGEAVFRTYFRKAVQTYSRVGARVVWAGRCRGVLGGGLDMPAWHDVTAVSYPSLAAFGRLTQNPGFQSKVGYRVAALEHAWIVMGQIQRSSGAS